MSRAIPRLSLQGNQTPGTVATDPRFHAIDREPHPGVAGVAGVLGNTGIGHARVTKFAVGRILIRNFPVNSISLSNSPAIGIERS
jgi:hypothetical protein